jgi:long-chain acyl-CoA synthetase
MPDTTPVTSPIPVSAVPTLLERAVARYADRPAMEFLGRRWTYRQFGSLVDRAARGLQDLGLARGDRVGLCLPNSPYFPILYYATLRAGGVVVNFNPLYVERELLHQVNDSGTTIMAVPDLAAIHGKVAAIAAEGGLRRVVVCPIAGVLPPLKAAIYRAMKRRETARTPRRDGLHIPFRRLIANAAPPDPIQVVPERDLAVLQYTGGTTGVPKGAMLTHANLTANARQVTMHMSGFAPGGERVLAVLPLFHVFAMTSAMNLAIEAGAELLLHPRFALEDVMRAIERQRVTIFPAVPTIYGAINKAAEGAAKGAAKGAGRDLTSIKTCISGGAPLPGEVRERFVALTGCKLVEGYGLTEASPVVACNPPDGPIRPGTVGIPMCGTTIEIRDPEAPHALLPIGERGEVCVRGPQVMAGYWGCPAETDAAFVDGALRTGDIGVLDAEGYLSIVDRIKDVILCAGYNVYPRVLEEALYEHSAVAEAVVIGVPDAYRGQVPKAFVVLREGAEATPESLREHLAGCVSKIEMPREIEIRASLPKTMIGKLSKKELVEEATAGAVAQ